MKKTILLWAISFFSFLTFSQSESSPGFQLGIEASPSIGWFNPDSDGLSNEGSKIGFNFGLIGDFNITKNYAFSTGLIIMSTGGEIEFPDRKNVNALEVGGRTTADIRLNYIQVPLTLKLSTNQIGYLTYFARFGFGLAVNYNAETDEEFEFPASSGTNNFDEVDYADEISLIRTSLIVGLGAEYNLSGNTALVLGLSLDNGINNILSEDIYDEDANGNGIGDRNQDFKSINNILVVNLGIIF